MKLFALTTVLILSVMSLTSAQPDTLWTHTYGGEGPERCSSVKQTTDGGYILAGSYEPPGSSVEDFWLVKTDPDGDTLWTRGFGGGDYDECSDVQQTTDGGFVLAGYTESSGAGWADFWLVKTDSDGMEDWSHTYGGTASDECISVQQTDDGGYVLAGYSEYTGAGEEDFWLVKTDSNGIEDWNHTYGRSYEDACLSVQQTEDGGYVLAGYTTYVPDGVADFWLVKTDPNTNGDTLWTRAYGGPNDDMCTSVQQTDDGGYVLAGYTFSSGAGGADFWLVKTDPNGSSLWTSTFGGSEDDGCMSVQQTEDGGYVMAGITYSFGADSGDFWLVKADANGDSLWSTKFGGDSLDDCFSVQQTNDDGFVLAGKTRSFGAGEYDIWLVKTGPDPSDVDDRLAPLPTSISLFAYPNPFNPTTTFSYDVPVRGIVKVDVYNVLGQHITTLLNQISDPGTHHLTWNAAHSPSGIYFVQLTTSFHTQTIKSVFLK